MFLTTKITPCALPLKPACLTLTHLRFLGTVREEEIGRYCSGGFHPVRIRDKFKDGRYDIVNKLGYGRYSTVWLAFDRDRQQHVTLKILTADSFGTGHDTFEVDILKTIRSYESTAVGKKYVLGLLDEFEHQGPNGSHVCLVFKAMGPDLGEYRRIFAKQRIPLSMMRDLS